ncbi:hypothetical protein [Lacinutrix sp. Bg11-31]|uniref:hypothetical protein n=1 Tax=Lacinutrix sp. Bg11-31 TaxID=2057808 RepID=UPI000C31B611|nr:hypothetical protein [Lacinutrix sp. Bg11-31]AUC81024.1 hypothetical protein CW733_02285 [Lacinutrix sp. Bg11-31]
MKKFKTMSLKNKTKHFALIKRNNVFAKKLILILCFVGLATLAHSQASLAAENRIDDIVVTTKNGEKKMYTVFRDAIAIDQFFYMPGALAITNKIDKEGNEIPDLTLLRFQYNTGNETIEGGILQGTMTMAAEPEVIETMKAYILKKAQKSELTKMPQLRKKIDEIRLSAMPLEECEFRILTNKGQFLGNPDTKTAFQGPLIANQKMGFSLNLNALGAAVISELATGKGGILIQVKMKYRGLTPPCGYGMEAGWKNVYSFYEQQTKKEGGISFWKFKFGGADTKNKLIESLEQTNDIKITRIKCDTINNSPEDQHFQKLKDKIENEVMSKEYQEREAHLNQLQSMFASTEDDDIKKKLLDKITDAEKAIQFGYQNSVKNINKRKQGSISYDSRTQYLQSRTTNFFSIIGFSKFNMTEEELKEKGHIIDINANDAFPYIAIGLEEINPAFDLRSIALDISYKNSEGNIHSEACRWTPKKGWTNFNGSKIGYLRFNLIGEKDIEKRNEPAVKIKLQVNSKLLNGSFVIEKDVQLEKGNKNIDALGIITKQLSIDGSNLSFYKITGDKTDLDFAEVKLKIGDLNIKKSIKPYAQNGIYGEPKPIVLLVPKDNSSISSEVTFITKKEEIKKTELIEITENTLRDLQWRTFDNE